MTEFLHIAGRPIGRGLPVYVIAEVSGNHHQSFEVAEDIIRAAKGAGADAVKLQTYTPDTMTIQSDQSCFQVRGGTLWDGRTLYDLYAEACTPWEWQPRLKKVAESLGMVLFSSAFDSTAVDFLEEMGVPAHKVASFELVDIALIRRMACTGKPLIMSIGMATVEEIEETLRNAREAGATQIALLKCTSAYPAPAEEMNLRTIPESGGCGCCGRQDGDRLEFGQSGRGDDLRHRSQTGGAAELLRKQDKPVGERAEACRCPGRGTSACVPFKPGVAANARVGLRSALGMGE